MVIELEGDDIRWGVGFSFLNRDLALAEQLADAVSPLTAFVYNREQRNLAGRTQLPHSLRYSVARCDSP
jgi:hypothetical protein